MLEDNCDQILGSVTTSRADRPATDCIGNTRRGMFRMDLGRTAYCLMVMGRYILLGMYVLN